MWTRLAGTSKSAMHVALDWERAGRRVYQTSRTPSFETPEPSLRKSIVVLAHRQRSRPGAAVWPLRDAGWAALMPDSSHQLLSPERQLPRGLTSETYIRPSSINAQSVCARMTALYRAAPWTLRLLGTSSVAVTAAVASAENPAERARSLVYIPLRVSRSLACGAACVAGTHPPPYMEWALV